MILITALAGQTAVAQGADSPNSALENSQPTVTVTRAACEALVSHVPDDDVAYKPGVDVHGRPVVPADGGTGQSVIDVPREIEFPVTVDFFENAGIAAPTGIGGEATLGRISFRNGRVYFNNTPLGDDAGKDDLIAACKAAGFR
ncbi:hypothetical protein [Thalassospira sp.]|uniref:hypothetical protein n=1 Tax=Thalassospira sp. TaxID=1912094 RepID=UPI0027330539|nr:hypothetical protein [Thalassospira sp.]MDP2697769.1 hypothetical protein [Thalassospira sp.]